MPMPANPTNHPEADVRVVQRRVVSGSRLGFIGVSLVFAWLVRFAYVDLLADSGQYDYMGVRAQEIPMAVLLGSLALAALPSLWLPAHLRRPTDLVTLYLFYAVHIPSCVLLPVVSESPIQKQLSYTLALTGVMALLVWRLPLPLIAFPEPKNRSLFFWGAFVIACIGILGSFSQSGYLTLENFNLLEVYDQRLELMARSAEIGRLFFYSANWTAGAIVPFLLIVGLHYRRYLLVAVGIVMALLSFVVSSNKLAYMFVPAVVGAYLTLRLTQGRHLALIMGSAFSLLGLGFVAFDSWVMSSPGGPEGYPLTWGGFFRIFCNNGFLSAVYLDIFSKLPPALYADSFARILILPQLDMSVPALAGASFSEVPDVHANAHLWADGYANLHYHGFLFSLFCVWLSYWFYESLTRCHIREIAAAGLVCFAVALANTSVHTAAISNGFLVFCALLYVWPGGRSAKPNPAA